MYEWMNEWMNEEKNKWLKERMFLRDNIYGQMEAYTMKDDDEFRFFPKESVTDRQIWPLKRMQQKTS